MKKNLAKFITLVLFIAMICVVSDFSFSWAESALDENVTDDSSLQEEEIVENVEEEMDFLYIESSCLETPGTQNIAVSWGEDITQISKMILQYEDSYGNESELEEFKRTDNSILFTKDFSSKEIGTYTVKGVRYYINDEEHYFSFHDVEIEASFEVVNEINDSIDENVATIELSSDSVEPSEVKEQVAEAMQEADLLLLASENKAIGKNVIVVLDPGHDNSSYGAGGNGLKEAELNLKIARYCKEELEQYNGVEVYLTHEGAGFTGSAPEDLQKRVNVAIQKNADILISLHINAGGGKGAEIYAPNRNYNRDQIYEIGHGVSDEILKELIALGLNNRGVKERLSGDTLYPDGSRADYYGIIRRAKLGGIPGIIVEHAFIDNASDATFLKSESNLKKLGVADAAGIASYFGLSKEPTVNVDENTYTINNIAANERLTVKESSLSDSAEIVTADKASDVTSSQRFEIISVGKGKYKIMAEHSGKVLGVKSGAASTGGNVQQSLWKNANSQIWSFVDAGTNDGSYYIKSSAGTYLTLNDSGVAAESLNQSEAQKWTLEVSENRPVADGFYSISNSLNDDMMVDISGASLKDGGNVQVYKSNKTLAQQFSVKYVGHGYYTITAEHSNKALDVAGGTVKEGVNLWQYASNGSNAQLWKFIDTGDGCYYIRSKLGTTVTAVTNNLANGTNVKMYAVSNKAAQKWNLEDITKTVNDGTYLILSDKDNLRSMTQKNGNTQINVFENIDSQKYIISYVSDGYYKISSKATGKVLEVAESRKTIKTNLREGVWKTTGNDNQLWRIASVGNGKYCLKSKLGTFVDVSSGSMEENNNIWMYSYNGTAAQIWTFDSSRVDMPEQPIEDGTYVFRSALKTSSVMDVSGGSIADKGNIQLYSSNNTSAQRFEVSYIGNGYYNIVSEKSGKLLDVAGGSKKIKANLWQYTDNGTDAQLWKFIDAGDGYYYLKSPKGTVVDVASARTKDGTNIWMYSLNGTNAQKWKPVKNMYKPVKEGTYIIMSNLSLSRILETADNTGSDGTNIRLGKATYEDNQRFNVEFADDSYGYYRISSVNNGKYLDVAGASSASGANLQLYSKNDSNGQLWKFIDAGNGYYYLRSKLGTAIDVASAKTAVGTNIQLYTMNGTKAQKWVLADATFTPIMGISDVTADRLAYYYNSTGNKYPYVNSSEAKDIKAFAQIYIEECEAEGIRADVAFCQAMKETGWLTFKGDVNANQYNFAGLGATGSANPGNSFDSIRIGIRAHVQHLKAYACNDQLVNKCVDPRFNYVQRGVAPYVEWLGQQENPTGKGWATAPEYGISIVKMMKEL